MNFSLRKISPLFGLLVAASACSNKSKITEDVLAQDSTLALSVMSANRDSLAPSLGDDSLTLAIKSGAISAPASAGATPPTVPAQKPAITLNPEPARPVASTPATARATVSGRSASRSRAATQTAATTTSRRSTKVSRTSRPTVLARANAQVGTQPQSERRTTDRAATTTRVNALIPAGSNIELTSDDQVCSSTSAVGDTFTTRVAENVVGPYGILIPKGSVATAEVFTKQNDSRTNSDADVGVRIQSVTVSGRTYPIESLVTSSDVTKVRRAHNDAGKVIAGAGVGAVLGRVLGRDTRSTVIGAVGGAAAGAVVARQTAKTESCIPDGGRITARLTEPLRVAISE
jgi:outer membrane lipoprotein SlyB